MIPRRRKPSHSCQPCRARKVRCDRAHPCSRCVAAGKTSQCVYGVDEQGRPTPSQPGQVVFLANPKAGRRGTPHGADSRVKLAASLATTSTVSTPEVASSAAHRPSTPAAATTVRAGPSDGSDTSSPRVQLMWNGSRATDSFIEPVAGRTVTTPKEVFRGVNDGTTTHWGRSHGAATIHEFPDAIKFLFASKESEVQQLYRVGAMTSTEPRANLPTEDLAEIAELTSLLPLRHVADRLLELYLQHFEYVYRILHIPSFKQQYLRLWEQPETSPGSLVVSVVAICAIALPFLPSADPDAIGLDTTATRWLAAIQAWIARQGGDAQGSLAYMQAHCLYLIAKKMLWFEIDTSWTSAGTLVRIAVAAGLHRDPADFIQVSPFWAEMRRRIWFVILELDLQLSFDHGRIPFISLDDYDCLPPSNLDDTQLTEGMKQLPALKTSPLVTQASAQILLAKSWPLRRRVCSVANKIRFDTPYEEILRLDAELGISIGEVAVLTVSEASTFRKVLLQDALCKASQALHRTFASRASYDPRFLYSRQLGVELSVQMLSEVLPSTAGDTGEPELFACVVNICRGSITKAVQILCSELLQQAKEQKRSIGRTSWHHSQQAVLVDLMERSITALKSQLGTDERSHRINSWLEIVVTLSKTVAKGDDAVKAMERALKSSIQAFTIAMRSGTQGEIQSNQAFSGSDADTIIDPSDMSEMFHDPNFYGLFSMNDVQSMTEWLLSSGL